jgi:hypothetical protein
MIRHASWASSSSSTTKKAHSHVERLVHLQILHPALLLQEMEDGLGFQRIGDLESEIADPAQL